MNGHKWYVSVAVLSGVIALMFLVFSIQALTHSLTGKDYYGDMFAAKAAFLMFGMFLGLGAFFSFLYMKGRMDERSRDMLKRPWAYRK